MDALERELAGEWGNKVSDELDTLDLPPVKSWTKCDQTKGGHVTTLIPGSPAPYCEACSRRLELPR